MLSRIIASLLVLGAAAAANGGDRGSWPWLDREHGIYGVFVTRSRFPRVASQFEAARTAAIEAATE